MKKKMNKTRERVAALLRDYPHLRDNDFDLVIAYWERHDGICEYIGILFWSALKNALRNMDLTSFETIRRCRQKLNEGGQYIGTSYKPRKAAEFEMRQWARE